MLPNIKNLHCKSLFFTIVLFLLCNSAVCKKVNPRSLIEDIADAKELKKLCRTKNNILILFTRNIKESSELFNTFTKVAEEIKGQATLALVDCSGEAKKLCKKLKVTPEPHVLKHYKDGEFHKDFERKHTVQSLVNFLKDPTGDLPWEEDDNAKDIVHLTNANLLGKLLNREKGPVLVMFYAPWCGFCKRMKPEFEALSKDLKGQVVLAAMDVNKPENGVVRQHFNITGFPTVFYFEGGQMKYKYEGENNKDSLIAFLKNPSNKPEKPKVEQWSDTPSEVVHLTDETFDSVIESEPSVLVMFYAPWCGHCKSMKPEYMKAAQDMKDNDLPGILAAVDATIEKNLGEKFKIKGYPTVKYFKNGEEPYDVNLRNADKIVEFMKNPVEPPKLPSEIPWSEEQSNVMHLKEEDFKPFLKRKKHVLVMFYAPWCAHCKKAKPEFIAAADYFKDDSKVEFAAIDCAKYASVCTAHDVSGYPTLKYFNYYKVEKPYEGGRTEPDFVEYMQAVVDGTPLPTPPPPPPPEQWWSELPNGQHVRYLKSETFDQTINAATSSLVMFYAPWCGHCKSMKPAFAEAAAKLKEKNVDCILGAVDATVERPLASKHSIKAFPTIKYFRSGNFVAEYNKGRNVDDLVQFMTNPPLVKEEL